MLSRVAENLYWIGRYVERAENVARLLDDGFHFELDAAGLADEAGQRGPVGNVLSILSCRDAFERRPAPHDRDAVLRYLTFDRQQSYSILAMIARARENARGSQETLSAETWSQINRLYLYLSGPRSQNRFQSSPFRFYDSIKRGCILFDGLVDSTLPRAEAFHFLQVGRYLERADTISRVVNVKFQTLPDESTDAGLRLRSIYWTSLLRSCSAYEAYLKEHQDRILSRNVVRYLVLDSDFPRAIRFCVDRCLESLRELSGGNGDGYGSEAERLLGRLDGELRYMDLDEVFPLGLAPFLTGVQEACNRVGQAIQQAYFLT
ncbi:MAG TPA: alpha-E domain-containing protein [Gemmataceae bacterium]|jgi:uncharacterized alpha-E superfamily protein